MTDANAGRTGQTKTIFITGAASGIGRATALYFAARGWFTGLFDMDETGLSAVAEEIGAARCVSARLDVTDRSGWDAAVAAFGAATGGRMDLFFNNAGIAGGGTFEEVHEEKAAQVLAVNLQGVVHGIYACLPLLKQTAAASGRATIVNTGSAAGIFGAPGLAVYTASKFAVRGLTEALNSELAVHKIEVCEIQPWFLDTKIIDTVPAGNNQSAREVLMRGKIPILPVSLAAEAVWQLAHAENPPVHLPVGKPARKAQFWARFFPVRMQRSARKRYLKQLGRND